MSFLYKRNNKYYGVIIRVRLKLIFGPSLIFEHQAYEADLPALPVHGDDQDEGGDERPRLDRVRRLLPVRLLALRLHPLLHRQHASGEWTWVYFYFAVRF